MKQDDWTVGGAQLKNVAVSRRHPHCYDLRHTQLSLSEKTFEFGVGVGMGFVAEFCLQAPQFHLEFTCDSTVGRVGDYVAHLRRVGHQVEERSLR